MFVLILCSRITHRNNKVWEKKSQLVKKKEEKVNNVILIQFGVNLLFIILTQYRTKVKNIPLSIVWGITPLFYYLLAHLWKKVKSSSESEKIFLWMVSFFILNVFAFFGMIGHRQNFGLVYLSS